MSRRRRFLRRKGDDFAETREGKDSHEPDRILVGSPVPFLLALAQDGASRTKERTGLLAREEEAPGRSGRGQLTFSLGNPVCRPHQPRLIKS